MIGVESSTPNGGRIALVYTPVTDRGRGYASDPVLITSFQTERTS
jgi:predicted GNAT family acetyltransferase